MSHWKETAYMQGFCFAHFCISQACTSAWLMGDTQYLKLTDEWLNGKFFWLHLRPLLQQVELYAKKVSTDIHQTWSCLVMDLVLPQLRLRNLWTN